MRSVEVVLHKPVSEFGIEAGAISGEITKVNELLTEGTVESFIDRIVLGRFDPRPVVLKVQLLAGDFKVAVEFGAIVSLNVLNLAIEEDMQAVEEILGGG